MPCHVNITEKGKNIFMTQISYDPVNISKIKCCNNNDNIIAKCQNRTELFAWKLYHNRNSLLVFLFIVLSIAASLWYCLNLVQCFVSKLISSHCFCFETTSGNFIGLFLTYSFLFQQLWFSSMHTVKVTVNPQGRTLPLSKCRKTPAVTSMLLQLHERKHNLAFIPILSASTSRCKMIFKKIPNCRLSRLSGEGI